MRAPDDRRPRRARAPGPGPRGSRSTPRRHHRGRSPRSRPREPPPPALRPAAPRRGNPSRPIRPQGTPRAAASTRWAEPSRSAHRQNYEGLVVEAADAAGAGDLAVGVEARHGRAAGVLGDACHLGLDAAVVAEDAAAGDAVEGEDADRRTA